MKTRQKPSDDGELRRLVDFYQMVRVDTYRFGQGNLLSDRARDDLFRYLDDHYVQRPETVTPYDPEEGDEYENIDLGVTEMWDGGKWVPK